MCVTYIILHIHIILHVTMHFLLTDSVTPRSDSIRQVQLLSLFYREENRYGEGKELCPLSHSLNFT